MKDGKRKRNENVRNGRGWEVDLSWDDKAIILKRKFESEVVDFGNDGRYLLQRRLTAGLLSVGLDQNAAKYVKMHMACSKTGQFSE